MESVQAYCVKCKCMRTIKQPQIRRTRSNRFAAQGKCPVCGAKVNKIVSAREFKEPVVEPVREVVEEMAEESEEVTPSYLALCRACGKEVPIIGEECATLWDGSKVVVGGRCTVCGVVGNFLNAKDS